MRVPAQLSSMRQETLVAADLVVEGCAHVVHIAVGIGEPFRWITVTGASEFVSAKPICWSPYMFCVL